MTREQMIAWLTLEGWEPCITSHLVVGVTKDRWIITENMLTAGGIITRCGWDVMADSQLTHFVDRATV